MIFSLSLAAVVLTACGNGASSISGSRSTSPSSASKSTTSTAPPVQDLQVVDNGFTQLAADSIGNSYVSEAAVLKWNKSSAIAEDVQVTLTLTNSSGTVVDSDNETIGAIFPGQTVAVAHSAQASGASAMKVQTSVGQIEAESKTPPTINTSGVTTTSDGYSLTTNGTITSTATKELKDLDAVAVYYNPSGQVIGGDFSFINFVPANGSTSFQITGSNDFPVGSTQVFASVSSLTVLSLN